MRAKAVGNLAKTRTNYSAESGMETEMEEGIKAGLTYPE